MACAMTVSVPFWKRDSNVQCGFLACNDTVKWKWKKKTVSNGSRLECMQVWSPLNKKFETFSYLPPLDDAAIAKEVDYMIRKGWTPCLEFDAMGHIHRSNHRSPGYYDGRYWTLWKLPLFGCSNAAQVVAEMEECRKAYPAAYIRCTAFDRHRRGQRLAFLVHKP